MQKISEVAGFPFLAKSIRYYEVRNNEIIEVANGASALKAAYSRALGGESKLYATWHGVRGTNMFFVDDLHGLGVVFGFEQSEHEHEIAWEYCYPDETGAYVTVKVEFTCGCKFNTSDRIRRLKQELLRCKGWDMSASAGIGVGDGKYTVSIKRNTIK